METNTIMRSYGIAPLPQDPVAAMAYVPFQPDSPEMCKPVPGFENGTVFKDLVKPFYGAKCTGGAT